MKTGGRRKLGVVGVVAGLLLVAVIAAVAWGRPLFAGSTRTMAAATATPQGTATATPNPIPLAPTGEAEMLSMVSTVRQVTPAAGATALPFQLTAAELALLEPQQDWRTGLAVGGQPTNLGVPHVASIPIGGPNPPGVIHDLSPLSFQGQDEATLAARTPTGPAALPSLSLCVGMTAEMELTSAAATFYDRSGHALSQLVSLDAFFGEPMTFTSPQGDEIVSWPTEARCTYDVSSRSWFAVATVIGLDLKTAQLYTRTHLDVATNQTEDPRTAWTVYQLDTTNDGLDSTPREQGCPCVSDDPLLGIDDAGVYVSTNEYSLAGEFLGARIYLLKKYEVVRHWQQVHMAQFTHLALGGTLVASVQPALFLDGAGTEYFMAALDPAGTFDNRLGIWAVTNENSLGPAGEPHLASAILHTETYGPPPSAGSAQPGSSVKLRGGNDAMQNVEHVDGELYGTVETAALPSGDSTVRTGAAWFVVRPQLGNDGSLHPSIDQQGYIATANISLLAPALGVAGDVDQVFSATAVGPGLFPTVVYTTTHPRYDSPFGHLATIGKSGQSAYAAGCGAASSGGSCPWFTSGSTDWEATNPAGEAWMWMAAGDAPQGHAAYGTTVFAIGPI